MKTKKYVIFEIFWLMLANLGTTRFTDVTTASDCAFLYNRVHQFRECLIHGEVLGVFFRNDFYGVGYGSSFFYGYLTLLPFTIFEDFTLFAKVFYIVSYLILYFGVRSFAKRFTDNYEFIAFVYMSSQFILNILEGTYLYLNVYAVGISFFFLAKCVDFFRDKKSYIPASLLFFLVINTHMITTLLSFSICVFLFIRYFDKTRIKEYLKFGVYTTIICSYYIINFLYHSENVLNPTIAYDDFIKSYTENKNKGIIPPLYGTSYTMGIWSSFLVLFSNKITGIYILSPLMLLICMIALKKRKSLSAYEQFILTVVLVAHMVGVCHIWMKFYEHFNIVIQFPLRYFFYTLLAFLLVCFKEDLNKHLKRVIIIISVFSVIITPLVYTDEFGKGDNLYPVGNGEYLSRDFIFDGETFDNLRLNCKFDFDKDYKYTYIHIDKQTDEWFTVPKLWYKGYVAEDENGNKLKLRMGYSQFIEINPENYTGTVRVYYKHPIWLYLLEIICYLCVLLGILCELFPKFMYKIKKNYFFKGEKLS